MTAEYDVAECVAYPVDYTTCTACVDRFGLEWQRKCSSKYYSAQCDIQYRDMVRNLTLNKYGGCFCYIVIEICKYQMNCKKTFVQWLFWMAVFYVIISAIKWWFSWNECNCLFYFSSYFLRTFNFNNDYYIFEKYVLSQFLGYIVLHISHNSYQRW